jgi:signal recognition particle GTPase
LSVYDISTIVCWQYDKQLLTYEAACKKLPIVSRITRHGGPPRDLPTLKKFLESGKRGRKMKQNISEYNQLQRVVTSVANEILRTLKKEKRDRKEEGTYAPKGVILYFEGLDCSGKSSTGGLVQAALEKAGYQVVMRQYNRPPTAEQR